MVSITIIRDLFPKHIEGQGTHYSANQDRENDYRFLQHMLLNDALPLCNICEKDICTIGLHRVITNDHLPLD